MDKEKNERDIFDMAGSGFESTVRLAKSSPEMWTPIFRLNKLNVIETLDEYINNLDNNYQIFGKEIKEEYSIPDGVNAFDKAKSFASEKVFKELSIYFKNDSQDFKNHIGKQLENMRISL